MQGDSLLGFGMSTMTLQNSTLVCHGHGRRRTLKQCRCRLRLELSALLSLVVGFLGRCVQPVACGLLFTCPGLDIVAEVPCASTCQCTTTSDNSSSDRDASSLTKQIVNTGPHVCSRKCRSACRCVELGDVATSTGATSEMQVQADCMQMTSVTFPAYRSNLSVTLEERDLCYTDDHLALVRQKHKPLCRLIYNKEVTVELVRQRARPPPQDWACFVALCGNSGDGCKALLD